ncbi:MAG: hypothetical protein ACXWL2_00230 [Candidatus Chromulinivorax sp.]
MKLHLQILGCLLFVIHLYAGMKREIELTPIKPKQSIEQVSNQPNQSQLSYIQSKAQQTKAFLSPVGQKLGTGNLGMIDTLFQLPKEDVANNSHVTSVSQGQKLNYVQQKAQGLKELLSPVGQSTSHLTGVDNWGIIDTIFQLPKAESVNKSVLSPLSESDSSLVVLDQSQEPVSSTSFDFVTAFKRDNPNYNYANSSILNKLNQKAVQFQKESLNKSANKLQLTNESNSSEQQIRKNILNETFDGSSLSSEQIKKEIEKIATIDISENPVSSNASIKLNSQELHNVVESIFKPMIELQKDYKNYMPQDFLTKLDELDINIKNALDDLINRSINESPESIINALHDQHLIFINKINSLNIFDGYKTIFNAEIKTFYERLQAKINEQNKINYTIIN